LSSIKYSKTKAYLRVRPFNAEEYKSIEKDEEINNALTLDQVSFTLQNSKS
jgi:hypothetical protein